MKTNEAIKEIIHAANAKLAASCKVSRDRAAMVETGAELVSLGHAYMESIGDDGVISGEELERINAKCDELVLRRIPEVDIGWVTGLAIRFAVGKVTKWLAVLCAAAFAVCGCANGTTRYQNGLLLGATTAGHVYVGYGSSHVVAPGGMMTRDVTEVTTPFLGGGTNYIHTVTTIDNRLAVTNAVGAPR